MAMTKLITPGSQDFSEPVAQLIKFSRRGLRGSDMDTFVKRASVRLFDKLSSVKFGPGEIPVHLIAIGATEKFGCNRNGDGFKEVTCREYHPTFVKYARWYREHQSRDKSKSRGIVKLSDYNERMSRVELVIALNGTKEAAERNGGLIADAEQEKLARDEDIGVSMGCSVSEDICSGCGHHAKTRAQYCGPEECTKYGGLRDNLAKTFEDGHILHADNPDPTFFDISNVQRPADRIAQTIGRAKFAAEYEQMVKCARARGGAEAGGAALAEKMGVAPPLWLLTEGPWSDKRIVKQLSVMEPLIELENALAKTGADTLDRAFDQSVQPVRTFAPAPHIKTAHIVAALADKKCMLPLSSFIAIVAQQDPSDAEKTASEVAPRLPGVYNRLASDPRLEEDLRQNPYLPAGPVLRTVQQWVTKHANEWSMARPRVVERLQLALLRNPHARTAPRPLTKVAATTATDAMAKEYALYQLGCLASLADQPDADFRQRLVIRSNYVQ